MRVTRVNKFEKAIIKMGIQSQDTTEHSDLDQPMKLHNMLGASAPNILCSFIG